MGERNLLLEITGLHKSFEQGTPVLENLDLTVEAGAIYGFLGLNGAGKTTTIRIVAGLLRPDGGQIRLLGSPWSGTDPAIKSRLGFVLDEPLYFDWLSAREYLEWNGRMYGLSQEVSHERAAELLDFLDLPGTDAQQISTFSTGMKKKISLAAAIIHKPSLVILDEPFEGIDPLAARDIRDTLTLMASRDSTILVTSHILETIEQLCSHVGILHRGRMLLECRMEEYRGHAEQMLRHTVTRSLADLFVGLVGDTKRKPPPSYV
jgi:ABC-2 type transport system ATP-binding protein